MQYIILPSLTRAEGAGLNQAKEGVWGEGGKGSQERKDNEHDGVQGVSGACVSQGLSRNSVPGPLLGRD